MLKRSQYN